MLYQLNSQQVKQNKLSCFIKLEIIIMFVFCFAFDKRIELSNIYLPKYVSSQPYKENFFYRVASEVKMLLSYKELSNIYLPMFCLVFKFLLLALFWRSILREVSDQGHIFLYV